MKTSTRVRHFERVFAVFTAMALLAMAFFVSPVSAQSEGVHATLLMYSGRENPRIELGSEEISQLRAFVGNLAENSQFKEDSVNPSILGYSGFVVVNEAKTSGLPEYLAGFGENLEASGPDGRRFYRDESRNIENWMVQRFMARDLVDEQGVKLIRSTK